MSSTPLAHDDEIAHEPAPSCGAVRRGRPPCKLPAGWGTSHLGIGRCKLHAGASPSHDKHAARIIGEAKAEELNARLAERLGERPNIGPAAASAHALEVGDQVLTWLYEDVLPAAGALSPTGQPSPWLDRLARMVADQVTAATRAGQLGVEERMAAVAEREIGVLEDVLRAAAAKLGIDLADARIRDVVANELRAIDTTSTER